MIGRVERKPRDRKELTKETQVRIVSAEKNAAVATITFDQAVVLRGTPKWTTDLPAITAVSAESPTPNVVEITFSATIATATELIIPVADPGIRSKVGGFVADTTFPLS